MSVIAIIQARVGSTRLPNKVLLDLKGKTVLERVIERVAASRLVDKIVVATTVSPDDLALVKLCAENLVSVFCGSEVDVLDRYYQAAGLFGAGQIVRITADCPLMDPAVIDKVIEEHLRAKADYTANIIKETYPDGEDVEVFTYAVLKKAWQNARLASEREHVTPYIRKHGELFKIVSVEQAENQRVKRWTLDNPEDYEFIKMVYDELFDGQRLFGMREVLEMLEKNEGAESINRHLARNSGYQKSLRADVVLGERDG